MKSRSSDRKSVITFEWGKAKAEPLRWGGVSLFLSLASNDRIIGRWRKKAEGNTSKTATLKLRQLRNDQISVENYERVTCSDRGTKDTGQKLPTSRLNGNYDNCWLYFIPESERERGEKKRVVCWPKTGVSNRSLNMFLRDGGRKKNDGLGIIRFFKLIYSLSRCVY